MVASIGKIGSLSRGVGYFEKDGYYARDDPGAPGEARSWAGKGAEVLGLAGPRAIPTRTAEFPAGGNLAAGTEKAIYRAGGLRSHPVRSQICLAARLGERR